MRLHSVVLAAAVGVGSLLSALNLLLSPSLSLLSADSTGVIALTILVLILLGLRDDRPAREAREPMVYRDRFPAREMYSLVRGARDGYVSSRRGVASVLSGAVTARLDTSRRTPSEPEVERYLRETLGTSYTQDLFPPQAENRARVPPSPSYVSNLKVALSLLTRRLGE